MKSLFVLMVSGVVLGGVAEAQTASGGSAGADPGDFYVEGIAQSSLSNVASQSYGAEAGFTISTGLKVFVEAGRIRDVATSDLGPNATTIAGALNQSQNGSFSYLVKEPVSFGIGGLRYLIPVAGSKLEPYVMGGFGVARYTKDVRFFDVNGKDVTANLAQYGVVLGSDLSGAFTRPMLSLGVGVTWPIRQVLFVDFQYRYGRIFADNQGINVNRVGIGVGVRF